MSAAARAGARQQKCGNGAGWERGGAGGSAAAEVQQRRTLPLEVYAPQGEEWRDAQPRARIRRRRHQQRAELRGCASGRFASGALRARLCRTLRHKITPWCW